MSFFLVDGYPVFLTSDKETTLAKLATESWDPMDAVDIAISGEHGDRLRKKRDTFMYSWLERQLRANPTAFLAEWVRFSFVGEVALDNFKRVLYDFCLLHGHCRLQGIPMERLLPEYDPMREMLMGDDWWLPYPKERLIRIIHTAQPRKWWWRYWPHRMKNREVVIEIDTAQVQFVTGDLNNFQVGSKDWSLFCSPESVRISTLTEDRAVQALKEVRVEWRSKSDGSTHQKGRS